jgi:hypothetical protein
MADPTWPGGTRKKNEDFGTSMGPVGTAGAVSTALEELRAFLRDARPSGAAHRAVFDSMRQALPELHQLMDAQQWGDLVARIEGMLSTLQDSAEDAGLVADLKLTGRVNQLLVNVRQLAAAARDQSD